jgi:tripartite-type tricarboxylate transporter receptor subunit TctC
MKGILRTALLAICTIAALATGPVSAQRRSDRPIFIIVPFTPGSGPDVLARIVGEEIRKVGTSPS